MSDIAHVAGVVIRNRGKYLLIQEGHGKAKGLWNLPAGHVDPGESLEDAATREAFEETGYHVAITAKLLNDMDGARPLHSFEAEIVSGTLVLPEEISDARWLSVEEVEALTANVRHQWVINSVRESHER